MRKETIPHLPKKGSKNSSSISLRKKLTVAFLLLSLPIYHQEVVLLFGNRLHHADDSVLCEHTVRYELEKLKIDHIDIVVAQSILETGNYRSQLVRTHNNLFGFRTNKGYLKFNTWKESCEYYKNWQKRKYKGGEYFRFLVAIGYAEDPHYVSKLKEVLRRMDS